MDKINGLSDDVLVKILTFLPTNVAVSTCILSKRWECLWMWLPKLDFFSLWLKKNGLRDFIYKNLPLHRAHVIERLSLHIYFNREIEPEDIKRWIEIAVSRYVRELEIDYSPKNENIFPSNFFTCKSLVSLKLNRVTLKDVPSMVCLPSLKTLQLKPVAPIDGRCLQHILSGCHVLEDLSVQLWLSNNMRVFTLTIPSLRSLSLFLHSNFSLDGYEIDTPCLEYLKLEDWTQRIHYSLIKNMPRLREAYVDVRPFQECFGSITSVKRLTICCREEDHVYGEGFVFDQLEHLELCVRKKEVSSNLLRQFLKDSPNLRKLDFSVLK
ncbi:hypothetical protein CARUB_v10007044mg, partial [Capsella rubella]